jgi:hypothetical protein
LRAIQDDDLEVTHMLASYFQLDFQLLSEIERDLLLTVAALGCVTQAQLLEQVDVSHRARLPGLLQSLKELGHLRREGENWIVGSEFLRRWLLIHHMIHPSGSRIAQESEVQEPEVVPAVRLDESNIEAVARQLGVTVERVAALTNSPIRSASEFFHRIRSFFIEIRHLIEQDEGYRLLITQGAEGKPQLRSEEEIQIALKHWLRPMCRAANIDLDREPQTGRGFLDFKLSIGHDFRCLVEVKLFSSAKLQDGLGIQLPIYLLADRCMYGIYVPIFLETSDHEVQMRELQVLATARARSHGVVIDVIDMRAWRPRAASKADFADDPSRYQSPPQILPTTMDGHNPNQLSTPSKDEAA